LFGRSRRRKTSRSGRRYCHATDNNPSFHDCISMLDRDFVDFFNRR
jgi:hypothetical protein